jgi:hypothetical protein
MEPNDSSQVRSQTLHVDPPVETEISAISLYVRRVPPQIAFGYRGKETKREGKYIAKKAIRGLPSCKASTVPT